MKKKGLSKCLFRESEGVRATWWVCDSCFGYLVCLLKNIFHLRVQKYIIKSCSFKFDQKEIPSKDLYKQKQVTD